MPHAQLNPQNVSQIPAMSYTDLKVSKTSLARVRKEGVDEDHPAHRLLAVAQNTVDKINETGRQIAGSSLVTENRKRLDLANAAEKAHKAFAKAATPLLTVGVEYMDSLNGEIAKEISFGERDTELRSILAHKYSTNKVLELCRNDPMTCRAVLAGPPVESMYGITGEQAQLLRDGFIRAVLPDVAANLAQQTRLTQASNDLVLDLTGELQALYNSPIIQKLKGQEIVH